MYHFSWPGAWSRSTRWLFRSVQEIRVVRGSRDVTANVPPVVGSENVTRTTTIGRVPSGSTPIFASTLFGVSGLPSIENVIGPRACDARSVLAVEIRVFEGSLAMRAKSLSVASPLGGR